MEEDSLLPQTKGENMEMKNVVMQSESVNARVYPTYKDRVFRMLFREKKRLLELYNALNDTAYEDEEELTVNTLENVIYMKRIMIPVPRYIVFYNGLERREEEFVQYLSESFLDEGGCIEITVKTINVNYDHNSDLLRKSPTLSGYAQFVAKIRKNLESMSLPQAVGDAVTECIKQNILTDFLTEQRNEVVAMSIYEYNEEYAMRVTYEDGEIAGYERGKAEGFGQTLVHNIEAAMKNFGISLEKACAGLDVTVEEYRCAKAQTTQAEK